MTAPIPDPAIAQEYRQPADVPTYRVCPHCKRQVFSYAFYTGAFVNETFACVEHGDITPILSAVVNHRAYAPDWSAA